MEQANRTHTGRGQSRFSKALPVPPANLDAGRRGKTNPFPSVSPNRVLPPTPKSSINSNVIIPRRPVGNQAGVKDASIISLSSANSPSPRIRQSSSDDSSVKNDPMKTIDAEISPPIPPKDNGWRQWADTPNPPNHLHSSSIDSTASSTYSPSSRPELWRRRSVKSDRNVTISDLKLTKSNGFTTSPPSMRESSPLSTAQHPPQPLPSQPTRTIIGLPGRSIKKPVPAGPAPAPSDPMGSKYSKIMKVENKVQSPGANKALAKETSTKAPLSPMKRLPTPEYQSNDKHLPQPVTPQVFPPVSPETPPSDRSPELPHDSAFIAEQVAGSGHLEAPHTPSLLLPAYSRGPGNTIAVTAEPLVPKSPQPQKTYASNILKPQPPRPRNTSSSTVPKLDHPAPAPAPAPVSSDAIFPSAPLTVVHFDCYQSHRSMRNSRNDLCPLECMVCEIKDVEKRWMCTWCSLRCCDACTKALAAIPRKDLREFLTSIGRSDRIGIGIRIAGREEMAAS